MSDERNQPVVEISGRGFDAEARIVTPSGGDDGQQTVLPPMPGRQYGAGPHGGVPPSPRR